MLLCDQTLYNLLQGVTNFQSSLLVVGGHLLKDPEIRCSGTHQSEIPPNKMTLGENFELLETVNQFYPDH